MPLKNTFCYALLTLIISLYSTNSQSETLAQFEAKLAEHKGKVVYIDFWASWCIPCRESFPWMNQMQSQYDNTLFTVLTVNLDSQRSFAEQFLLENKANFPVFYDPKGMVAKAFKLKGMPSSFIVDKTGKIVSSHVGFNENKKRLYQQEIEALLKP
jgi:thiol-disulfide isomerase/thioredoxin